MIDSWLIPEGQDAPLYAHRYLHSKPVCMPNPHSNYTCDDIIFFRGDPTHLATWAAYTCHFLEQEWGYDCTGCTCGGWLRFVNFGVFYILPIAPVALLLVAFVIEVFNRNVRQLHPANSLL